MKFDPIKNDKSCANLIENEETEELYSWLSRGDGVERTLGEHASQNDTEAFAAELSMLGAENVWVVDIERATEEYRQENSGLIVVALSENEHERRSLLEFGNDISVRQGFDEVPDCGQKYLLFKLD